ncbi:MAG: hypothetical protein ABFR97_10535 [Thermodesulfobacteriota bacterium]
MKVRYSLLAATLLMAFTQAPALADELDVTMTLMAEEEASGEDVTRTIEVPQQDREQVRSQLRQEDGSGEQVRRQQREQVREMRDGSGSGSTSREQMMEMRQAQGDGGQGGRH